MHCFNDQHEIVFHKFWILHLKKKVEFVQENDLRYKRNLVFAEIRPNHVDNIMGGEVSMTFSLPSLWTLKFIQLAK